ncbi:MAG: glutaredoxin domain-containing protein [Candidatus Diapherotrites archaeon]
MKTKKTQNKNKKPKITIYTTPTCIFCNLAKEFFKKNKIKYQEFDVLEDEEKAKEMIQKSGQQGVPVIDINGKIIIGFDRNAIKKELGIKD